MVKKIKTNKEILSLIHRYYAKYYAPLTPRWKGLLEDPLNEKRNYERFDNISFLSGVDDLSQKKILEIGSGFGSFVISANQNNMNCVGIEPDRYAVLASRELCKENHIHSPICCGVGEHLPFKDCSFDLVVSFQVLEHTRDPEQVLGEAVRVLKEGGILYFNVPNHNFLWEAHYGIIWPTFLPKAITKFYVRLKKRDPTFFDSIRILNKKKLLAYLENKALTVMSFGEELWEKRLERVAFTTYGHTKKLMTVLTFIEKMRILGIIKTITLKLDIFYPLIVVGKKSSSETADNK